MFLKINQKNGERVGKKGQVTLEIALALTCIFLLLLGSMKIFLWANNRFIIRQEDYESDPTKGRVAAGSSGSGAEVIVDESAYPKLDIFGN